jgi:hypothetical protein
MQLKGWKWRARPFSQVRILLDEYLPARLAPELTGHQVRRSGWTGLKNGELLRRAPHEFGVFLTIDQSIWHQQDTPPAVALITLQAPSNRLEALRPLVPAILRRLRSKYENSRLTSPKATNLLRPYFCVDHLHTHSHNRIQTS